MSSLDGIEWNYQGFNVRGVSLAGTRTSFVLPDYRICFDVAQGFPWQISSQKFFISHGHLDHAGGIPYIISQKGMNSHEPPTFYVPPSLKGPLEEILNIWSRIEQHKYNYQIESVSNGQIIELNKHDSIEVFQTVHRIESFGYSLLRHGKKLKPEFKSLNATEITQLKRNKVMIDENYQQRVFSFTGDTQIEVLDQSPQIKNSKILFLESTFIDDSKPLLSARKWGHTHLDEIISREAELSCEKIVLIHISGRYSTKYAQDLLVKKLGPEKAARFEIFQGR